MTATPRIFWRYARLDDLERADTASLTAQLGPNERRELEHWRHADRRRGWLLARVLARQLVRAHAMRPAAGEPAIEICSLGADLRGVRPVVQIAGAPARLSLSMSHTDDGILVGLCTTPGFEVGVDLVRPVALPKGFIDTWLTDAERARLTLGDSLEPCRLWAAKEAVYKAANWYDSFAPRQICVRPGPDGCYRCSYRDVDLGDRCPVAVWQCDGHIAARAVVASDWSADEAGARTSRALDNGFNRLENFFSVRSRA